MEEYSGYISGEATFRLDDLGPFGSSTKEDPFPGWSFGRRRELGTCYSFAAGARLPENFSELWGLKDSSGDEKVQFTIYQPNPGTTGGRPFSEVTFENLKSAILADGFVALPYKKQKDILIPSGSYVIAGLFDPKEEDAHFLRYHPSSRSWYHKPGWEHPVTNLDFAGKKMRDLHQADLGGNTEFLGFFLSSPRRPVVVPTIEDVSGRLMFGPSLQ